MQKKKKELQKRGVNFKNVYIVNVIISVKERESQGRDAGY